MEVILGRAFGASAGAGYGDWLDDNGGIVYVVGRVGLFSGFLVGDGEEFGRFAG